jgi:hypothetical protein
MVGVTFTRCASMVVFAMRRPPGKIGGLNLSLEMSRDFLPGIQLNWRYRPRTVVFRIRSRNLVVGEVTLEFHVRLGVEAGAAAAQIHWSHIAI